MLLPARRSRRKPVKTPELLIKMPQVAKPAPGTDFHDRVFGRDQQAIGIPHPKLVDIPGRRRMEIPLEFPVHVFLGLIGHFEQIGKPGSEMLGLGNLIQQRDQPIRQRFLLAAVLQK